MIGSSGNGLCRPDILRIAAHLVAEEHALWAAMDREAHVTLE